MNGSASLGGNLAGGAHTGAARNGAGDEQSVAVVDGELQSAKLLRAVYSDRQLEEVLTDFWFNHFNIYIEQGCRPLPGYVL